MSTVGFGFSFRLVILENPGTDCKIIEIVSRIVLYMNESALLVKTSYISVHTLHAKCRPFKYRWWALSSKVCKRIWVPWWRSCVRMCVYIVSIPLRLCVCVWVVSIPNTKKNQVTEVARHYINLRVIQKSTPIYLSLLAFRKHSSTYHHKCIAGLKNIWV